ncbi:hypothetical protein AKN88_08920 [Thiopseudomonas alkaliphila]|uniref:Polysaccharide pyruvyl transferase domain-containing protein n=1 Tax=Thiopseudomonas alkaliphila TaxID=1697053 RepID=A0A0K1XFS7_9GAMM|nr:hypothetical protein AKN88_08920 [Thiopseudomonas alkaliphila]
MLNIGLVTINKTVNYGAVLQAYATQVVFSNYGNTVIINYENPFLSEHIKLIRFEWSVRGVLMLVHDLLRLPFRCLALQRFYSFFHNKYNWSAKVNSATIGKLNYEYFICGSDQIWNPDILNSSSEIDPVYFLDFVKNPSSVKASFSSSIGHYNYSAEECLIISKMLDDFKSISVRELDGVDKVRKILPSREVEHTLDPTLLLDKKVWTDLVKNIKYQVPKKEYILIYTVPRSQLLKEAVEYFSKKLNYEVVLVDQMLLPLSNLIDKHIRSAGPLEFLKLFLGARFVITDSFHGTCFSLNFGIPFATINAGKKNNRIKSLFDLLDVDQRLVSSFEDLEKIDTNSASDVSAKLKKVREHSFKYINKIFC